MGRRNMPEWYRVPTPRLDEKFALHGRSESKCPLPSVCGPLHNDFRQILLSQPPKEFENWSIFFSSWGSWANSPMTSRAVESGKEKGDKSRNQQLFTDLSERYGPLSAFSFGLAQRQSAFRSQFPFSTPDRA